MKGADVNPLLHGFGSGVAFTHDVGTIDIREDIGVVPADEDRKRTPALQAQNSRYLPAARDIGHRSLSAEERLALAEWQFPDRAEYQALPDVESGKTALGREVLAIHCRGPRWRHVVRSPGRVVDRLAVGVRQEKREAIRIALFEPREQTVVARISYGVEKCDAAELRIGP